MKISRQKHRNKLLLALAGSILVTFIALAFYAKELTSQIQIVAEVTPTSYTTSTPTLMPEAWHINNTQEWATYSNPEAPFTIQYPPQWGYFEQTGGNIAGVEKTIPLYAVSFHNVPIKNEPPYSNIYFIWAEGVDKAFGCDAHLTIQLKDEVITACGHKTNDEYTGWQADNIGPRQNIILRASTSKTVSKEQILNMLSTLSFTK